MKINTLTLAKDFIKQYLKEGDIAIDATMGNGNDTLFLCKIVGKNGKVLAFDIQQKAIDTTRQKLLEQNMQNIANLILDSHENMEKYIDKKVDAIMFNLGYLPKSDHNIKTNAKTTIKTLQNSLNILKIGGIISICVYQGKDTGFEEKEEVLKFVKSLDYNKYIVLVTELFNKPNYPPMLVNIIKHSDK